MNKKIPEINSRFLSIITLMGYTGYKLAKEVSEISQSKLTHIRSGRNEPSKEMIFALVKKFPQINLTWLLTGDGDMVLDINSDDSDNYINTINDDKINIDKIVDTILMYPEKFEKNIRFLKYIESKCDKAIIEYQTELILKSKKQ